MHNPKWLALETSTDLLSLAVARGPQTWTHTGPGGALTSTHMIPQTMALLAEAGLASVSYTHLTLPTIYSV